MEVLDNSRKVAQVAQATNKKGFTMIASHDRSIANLAWLREHDPIPVIAWLEPEAQAEGFEPTDVYVETTGALAIFKSGECLSTATRGTDR